MIQYWRKTIIFWHTPPLTFQGRAQFGYNSCQKRRQLVIEHGLCFPTRIQLSCLLWDFPTRRWLPSFPTRFVLSSLVWFWHCCHTTYLWWIQLLQGSVDKDSFPLCYQFQFRTSNLTILASNQPHNFTHLPITPFHIVLVHQDHVSFTYLAQTFLLTMMMLFKSARYFSLHRFQKWIDNHARYLNLLRNPISLSSSSFLTSSGRLNNQRP